MKRYIVVFSLLIPLMLTLHPAPAQTFMPVNGRPVRRQLESMVILRWDKQYFRPQWYYLLFHHKYRKGEDRRTLLQLLPTAGLVRINEEKASKQKEDTQEVGRQELWSYINHRANAHYYLIFQAKLDRLSEEITALIGQGKTLGMEPSVIARMQQEQQRLADEITIIKEGYLDEGLKSEAFLGIEQEMQALKGLISELLHVYQIYHQYK